MPNAIKITSPDMDRFLKYLLSHPKVMLRHAQIAMKKSLFVLEASAKGHAPSNEGTLRKGIRTVLQEMRGSVVATAPHSEPVHEGSKAHWPPSEPNSSLDRWARARGIPTFVVARAIARKGTKAQPFFDQAIDDKEITVDRFYKQALDDAVTEIARS